MRTTATALLLFFGHASAGGKPELSFTVKDGTDGGLASAISPKLSYAGDYGGVNLAASLDSDLSKSVSAEKNLNMPGGWNLRSHAEYTEGKYNYHNEAGRGVYLTLEATDEEKDTYAWCSGCFSTSEALPLKVGGKRIQDTNAGKFMVEPRFNFETSTPDVCLGYEKEDDDSDTRVYLTASKDEQNVKVIHRRPSTGTTASVKVGTNGGFYKAELQQETDVLGNVKLAVTKDDVDVQAQQNGWTAGVNVATNDGFSLSSSEPKVRFSKQVSFSV